MKNTQSGFTGMIITITAALALVVGGTYYATKQKQEAKVENATSIVAAQDSKNIASSDDFKTYVNSQFGVKFTYPTNKVSISNNNVFSKNSGRFVNFDIKSGGNFAFDILHDSDKMTPPFSTELDEVKFKMSISAGWNDITKYSQFNLNGQTAYRAQAYAKGYNDSHECTHEKIITKKDGYWYEFYAKVCDGNTSESLKTFNSVATTLTFDK